MPSFFSNDKSAECLRIREIILRTSFYLLLACLFFSAGAFAQPAAEIGIKAGIEEIYLAKDDGTGKAGEEAAGFLTTDIPIYCVVILHPAGPVTVRMNLVAVSVSGVKAETRVVSTSYTTKTNQNRVNFSGRPDGAWNAGKYRADIYINNELAKNSILKSGGPQL